MLTPNDDIVKKFDIKQLNTAKLDDNRHRLHAEQAKSLRQASPYMRQLIREYVNTVITAPGKRAEVIKQMVWPPVTVETVDEIIDMASAVHHAEDRFIKVDFTDASLEADWNEFIERKAIEQFITRNCHNALFGLPNSLVIHDLSVDQDTAFPEPYVYLLSLERVRAVKALTGPSDNGLLEFVWFDTDTPGITALFDKVDRCLFRAIGNGEWEEIPGTKQPHNWPYCPAYKMWDDVDDRNPLSSNTMISPLLGLLDRMLLWDAFAEVADLTNAFMYFWYYEESDDPFTDPMKPLVKDDTCRPTGVDENGTPFAPLNPTCVDPSNKKQYGPGSVIPVPLPRDKTDADIRPPAGYIAPPVPNLEYVAKKVETLKLRIRSTATGYDTNSNGQPINERQVLSIMERSRLIYQYLAEHFEVLTRRILAGLARDRYGNYFTGLTVNLGRRVSMLTGDQLIEMYQAAKDAGVGMWLLEELTTQQQQYFARSDASRQLRYKVIRSLNDYAYLSNEELTSLQINIINPEGYKMTVGLPGFIYRFERENDMSIEQFCNAPNYNDRVSQILTRFKSYVAEQKPADPAPGFPGGQNPTTGNRNNSGKPTGTGNRRKAKPAENG